MLSEGMMEVQPVQTQLVRMVVILGPGDRRGPVLGTAVPVMLFVRRARPSVNTPRVDFRKVPYP
jgi:hypothetical protein